MSSNSCSSASFHFFQGLNSTGIKAIDIVVDNALSHFHIDRCVDAPPRMPRHETVRKLNEERFPSGKAKLTHLHYSVPLNFDRWDSSSSQIKSKAGTRNTQSNGDSAPGVICRTRGCAPHKMDYHFTSTHKRISNQGNWHMRGTKRVSL